MVYHKSTGYNSPFLGKGASIGLLGLKGMASVLDNGIAQGVVSALSPEIGGLVTAASKAGLLQKAKNM